LFKVTVNGGKPLNTAQLPATFNGIHVRIKGTNLFYVTIQAIDLTLTYTGEDYSWSLNVPWSKYYNKTEGLCGT